MTKYKETCRLLHRLRAACKAFMNPKHEPVMRSPSFTLDYLCARLSDDGTVLTVTKHDLSPFFASRDISGKDGNVSFYAKNNSYLDLSPYFIRLKKDEEAKARVTEETTRAHGTKEPTP